MNRAVTAVIRIKGTKMFRIERPKNWFPGQDNDIAGHAAKADDLMNSFLQGYFKGAGATLADWTWEDAEAGVDYSYLPEIKF